MKNDEITKTIALIYSYYSNVTLLIETGKICIFASYKNIKYSTEYDSTQQIANPAYASVGLCPGVTADTNSIAAIALSNSSKAHCRRR